MIDWNRARFEWLQQVMAGAFSSTAKLLACALATRFADFDTGESFPSKETLAQAVGRSARSVQSAVKELEAAGWLAVSRRRGRGRSSTYQLAFPAGCEPEKRRSVVPISEAREARKRRSRRHQKGEAGFSPVPEHRSEHMARANRQGAHRAGGQRSGATGRPIPEEFETRPSRIEGWERWLAEKGWPALEELGLIGRQRGEDGALVPFSHPPNASNPADQDLASAFFELKSGRRLSAGPADQVEQRRASAGG